MVNNHTPLEAKVVFIKTNELQATSKFVELHNAEDISKFVAAVDELNIIPPVIVDERGNVLAGNIKLVAAQKLNLISLPTVRADLLTTEELMRFSQESMLIAYDLGLGTNFLKVELQELKAIGLNMKFLIQNEDEEDGFTAV